MIRSIVRCLVAVGTGAVFSTVLAAPACAEASELNEITVAVADNVLDPIPAPIETGPLPDIETGAEPESDVAPAAPGTAPTVVQPGALREPKSEFGRVLLARLKPIAQPKRKLLDRAGEAELRRKRDIWRFYAERGGEPVWLVDGRFSDTALQVVAEIANARDWGLDPARFDVPVSVPASATLSAQIDVELKFASAVLDYARTAQTGQVDPVKLSDYIDRMSVATRTYTVLKQVSEAKDVSGALTSYHPKHPQFVKLRELYLAMRDGKEISRPQLTIPDGPKLKPGSSHPHIALLRQRLGLPAPLSADGAQGNPAEFYDPALVAIVKQQQDKYGFRTDGVIGRSLRQALNRESAPVERPDKTMDRILANMERWRWVPNELGSTYILNNIPDMMTRLIRNGQVVFEERIIVGKPSTPTSIFSNQMSYLEFNPRWNVPNSIKVNELQRGGAYALARRGLRVSYGGRDRDPQSIDWNRVDIRSVNVFQPPGPGNALGRVKFMFPNKHDIYMHDTPDKGLFLERTRTFSHGCVRVRNPQAFAEAVMREGNGWLPEQVQAYWNTRENAQVQLDRKIPVHITYFTAWVEDDGKLTTKSDFYGHDRRTTLALAGRYDEIDRQEAPKVERPSGFSSAAVSRQRSVVSPGNQQTSLFSIFDVTPGESESYDVQSQPRWLR